MQRISSKTPISAQKTFKCSFQGNPRRQKCPFYLEETRSYFMQRAGLKTPISAQKRFECSFPGNA